MVEEMVTLGTDCHICHCVLGIEELHQPYPPWEQNVVIDIRSVG